LANLYREQERYREADQLYQQALQILQQTLEPQHPLIASALNNLAVLYVSNLGRHRDAESLYQQALPICEQTLGLEHALTQGIAGNYIFLLHAMGQETEALALEARFFLSQSAG
jgi:tetratricopeptide (TPR) repeat protein